MKRTALLIVGAIGVANLGVLPLFPVSAVQAEDREPRVVKEAKKVEEAKKEATYKLPEDGQVWLVDMTAGEKVLHSISLKRGFTYGFNTKKDYVLVNDKRGEDVKLDSDHTYAIFYVSEADRDAAGVAGRKRDVRRDDKDSNDDRRGHADRARPVPNSAKVVDEGKNEELDYKADGDGMVYLYDGSEDKLVESFRLQDGDRIVISPKSNAVAINRKTVKSDDLDLNKKHTYKLLFDVKK